MKNAKFNNESGMALIFAIGLLALLLMIGMAFVGNAVNYRKVAENNSARTQSRMFALSAVNRAMVSLMAYSHQYAKANEGSIAVRALDHIYSYGAYDNDGKVASGGETYTDGLLGTKFKHKLDGENSPFGVDYTEKFNEMFEKEKWQGNWVFFTNGRTGDDRRIIGRAAWQMLGSSAVLSASAFMRGHLSNPNAVDPDFVPADEYHRWGREIDEAFLDEDDGTVLGNVSKDSVGVFEDTILDSYDPDIYTVLKMPEDEEKKTDVQVWARKWFIPEEDASKVWDAARIKHESYGENLLRFNISEVGGGNNWSGKGYPAGDQWYARFGGSDANSLVAVERLSDDSFDCSEAADVDHTDVAAGNYNGLPFLRRIGDNQETFASLGDLRKQIAANFNDYCDADSTPSSNVSADKWLEMEYDSANDIWNIEHPDFTGNEKTPYIYEAGMNMGILPAPADWSNPTDVASFITAKKQSSGEFKIDPIMIKAAPILKLCNIYPFDPAETVNGNRIFNPFSPSSSDDFMRGYVDFGDMVVNMRLRKVILKNVKFSYDVEVPNADPALPPTPLKGEWSCDVVLTIPLPLASGISVPDDRLTLFDQKDPNPPVGDPDKTIAEIVFKGKKWRNSNGVELDTSTTSSKTNVKPIIFSEADVDNSGGAKPYPVKKTSVATDSQWQMLEYGQLTTSDAPYLQIPALGIGISDLFYDTGATDNSKYAYRDGVKLYNTGYTPVAPGTEISNAQLQDLKTALLVDSTKVQIDCSNLNDITIESVWIEKISTTIRRMVLTANKGTQDVPLEIGVDYVRGLALTDSNVNPDYNASDPDSDYNAFAVKQDVVLFNNGGNYQGIILGAFRNYDPRQNLNAGDWRIFKPASSASYVAANYLAPSNSEVSAVMNISSGGDGEKNSGSGSKPFSPQYSSSDNEQDWETANEPAFLGTDAEKHISTAVIRNAPMMSPWEIGFIHRGAAWQTINIKDNGTGDKSKTNSLMKPHGGSWDSAGTSYTFGDAAILEQIRMTDHSKTYGKINLNIIENNEYDKAIVKALFRGLIYDEAPAAFIKNSTRDSNGKFPANTAIERTGTVVDSTLAQNIADAFTNDRSKTGRANFIALGTLEDAFGQITVRDTDAAQEEIIGKTINLLSAPESPSVAYIVIVAQSIRDRSGVQVRMKPDKYATYTAKGGTLNVDTDTADMDCKFGRFDMAAHGSDPDKNIYFDDITGEVKILVQVSVNGGKLKMTDIKYIYD